MAQFFLHLHECGTSSIDEDGAEYVDLADARSYAVTCARNVMSEEVLSGRLCLSCYIAIEDQSHHEVARLLFRDLITVTGQ